MKRRYLISSALIALMSSGAAVAQSGQTSADTASEDSSAGSGTNEIIVTAQKREQRLQDVPIAVSAFDETALEAQGVDGGRSLLLAVPNVTFQRRTLRNNFQIRGVGSQLTATGGDDGVGIHLNGAPLTENLIADSDFYDVQRVEVLRGPQGTLYGRNATGGVVNVITNKPTDTLGGSLTAEFGNFDSVRVKGFFNTPLIEGVNVRVAGFALNRSGYATNTLTGDDVDGRKIVSGRGTIGFDFSPSFRASLMWEIFDEDDDRGAFLKQLCSKDAGLTEVLGVPTGGAQVAFTKGCEGVGIYGDDVYEATNMLSSFSGILARQFGLQPVDSFAGKVISRDLREVELYRSPTYKVHADIAQFNMEYDVSDALTTTFLLGYSENHTYTRYDSTGGNPSVAFPISSLAPNGVLNDPQIGLSDRLHSESGGKRDHEQWSAELRLQSDFDGPVNFNIGALYLKYDAETITPYVGTNAATRIVATLVPTAYIDPLYDLDFTGHNYFISQNEYTLKSKALMGEIYAEPLDDVRVTVGLRYTDDDKWTRGSGSTLFAPGRGPIWDDPQTARFKELTGRFNIDWSPNLSFTDQTLFYASYSKGYKGGGFNPPGVVTLGLKTTYDPEFVNAFEIGTKNTLAGGRVTLNLTGFYYDYKGYQVGRSVNRSVFNDNIDATIKGLEGEFVVEPLDGLRFNATLGLLDTRIDEGSVVDPHDRTLGNSAYILANSTSGGCILNAEGVAAVLATATGRALLANFACGGVNLSPTASATAQAAAALFDAAGVYDYGPGVSVFSSGAGEGVLQNLVGNELPNAPSMTLSLGAEYQFALNSDWDLTLHADYYRQSSSFQRYNNAIFDKVRGWENVNTSVLFDNHDIDLSIQFFVKNIFNKDTIVGFSIADENLGSVRTPYLLEPRLFGVAVTKRF